MKDNNFAIIATPSFTLTNDLKEYATTLLDLENINNVVSDIKKAGIKNILLICANSEEFFKVNNLCKHKLASVDLRSSEEALKFYTNQLKRYMDAKLTFEQILTILNTSIANTSLI